MADGPLREIFNGAVWEVRSRLRPFPATILDRPNLSGEDLVAGEEAIARSRVYLEFGSGGSTVFAAARCPFLVSVESDRRIIARVKRRIGTLSPDHHLIHADIGWTRKKGYPVLSGRSLAARGRRYAEAPWPVLERAGRVPDLVFVDGRFRVASFLETLLRLPADWTGQIMIDNASRPFYRPIFELAELVHRPRLLAFFRMPPALDRAKCRAVLEEHYADPR